jgi:hypothetical protein
MLGLEWTQWIMLSLSRFNTSERSEQMTLGFYPLLDEPRGSGQVQLSLTRVDGQ